MSKYFKKVIVFFVSSLLLMGLLVISILWAFSAKLPDYKFLKSYKPSVSSKVYSGEGELVDDFSSEKRIFIPYNKVDSDLVQDNFFHQPHC